MQVRKFATPLFGGQVSGGRIGKAAMLTGLTLVLAGCGAGSNFDWDMRPSGRFSTTAAAQANTAARPQPDARGIISYPGYQVVVAGRGEQVSTIAERLGLSPRELAAHNALEPTTALRGGELLVLPSRVGDAGPVPGTITATPLAPAPVAGPEPVQHAVRRGETAFSIARLYQVTPRSLSEWNGLDDSMNVREGQILMIPVAQVAAATSAPLNATDLTPTPQTPATPEATTLPGEGSETPVPPSASLPLPAATPVPAGQTADNATPPEPVADLSAQRTQGPQLAMPVQGRIIRAYSRGRNDGIGIGAPAGTAVMAAASGTVAAITRDTDQVPILVIRHQNNLLTVYANIDDITVERGDSISRGQSIATVRRGDPSFLHFEVREGFESVDPMPYLQ